MAKRKSKKPQEDTSILLEPSQSQSRKKTSSYSSPALLFIVLFTVGVSVMGWFCVQQQQSLDQLSESLVSMQKRVTNLQQAMQLLQVANTQTDVGSAVEERIYALEEAQKQAQEKAEFALATSENLKYSDLRSQLWELREEMDTRITEIKQASLSVTTLQVMFQNQSQDFEAVKESVVAGLSSSSALAENVAGLTNTLAGVCSSVDKQVASVEALNAQLEGQVSDLNELKESLHLHNVALQTNNQEIAAIKELAKAKQATRARVLEEMLSSVQTTLDEQFSTSQNLRSSVMTQLQTFHSQLENAHSQSVKTNEEDPAAEEFTSTTTQDDTEPEDAVEKDDTEEEAEQEPEEEEEQQEAVQDEQPLEQEVEEKEIPHEEEEVEEEDITQQSEEREAAKDTAVEEEVEETVDTDDVEEEEDAMEEEEDDVEEEEDDVEEEEDDVEEEEDDVEEEEDDVEEEEDDIEDSADDDVFLAKTEEDR